MTEFISSPGKPTKIIMDQDTEFTASVFEQFYRDHNIIHVKIVLISPWSNGNVEIINGIIVRCLPMTMERQDTTDWDLRLMKVQWSINNSKNCVTKCKPLT